MLIIAHRGASAIELENTRAAFKAARELGADAVELDVHATSDGEIVVHHNPIVNGVYIPTTTSSTVQSTELANGETVPKLYEILDLLGTNCTTFVEVKTLPEQFDGRLLDVLSQGPNPSHYHIHGFNHRLVNRIVKKAPRISAGILSSSYPMDPVTPVEQAGACALWQRAPLIDQRLIDSIHQANYKIYAWTVDDSLHAQDLAQMGVDGICTNVPDVIRRAVQ